MLKAAVTSALLYTTLRPVCLYYGDASPMLSYLDALGVTVIRHTPQWAQTVYETRDKIVVSEPLLVTHSLLYYDACQLLHSPLTHSTFR